jgi:hypothetical protein
MDVPGGVKIIIGLTTGLIILLISMIVIIHRRRNKIISMGWLVNGTVIDIVEQRGFKDEYYISFIEYMHHKLGKTRAQRFSARLPRRYAKGSEVGLYYHTDKPEKIVLEKDNTSKVAMLILGIVALAVLVAGILGVRFLLNHTYT